MSGVERFVRKIDEIGYRVDASALRNAVLRWLEDEHNASFTNATAVVFDEDGALVTTRFVTSKEDA